MTTNPYAEAVEAAQKATTSPTCCSHDVDPYEVCLECAVAAAVGPLLAPVRALADEWEQAPAVRARPTLLVCADELRERLDLLAIEAGATSEGVQP